MDAASVIRGQLSSDEKLLWSDQPVQGLILRAADLLLIPFSLLWGGFAFFWEWAVLTKVPTSADPIGRIFPLWGIPFVLAGVYLIIGRFFTDAWIRSRTAYAVTNQRILIASGVFSRKVESFPLRTLPQLELTEKSSGRGTIRIGANSGAGAAFLVPGWPSLRGQRAPCLDGIENARRVYALILDTQRQVDRR